MTDVDDGSGTRLSRRTLLQSAGGAAALGAVGAGAQEAAPRAAAAASSPPATSTARAVNLRINGRSYALELEPRVTLLDALREYAGLPGTKKGCDRGQCGACTVLVNGRRINACLTLAVMQEGAEIMTIEGLGTPEAMHPMQKAFIEHDAFQCGYCTPGQICSAVALLGEHRNGQASAVTADLRAGMTMLSDDELRERMSGNLCRCGAYTNIVAAVRSVASRS
jgi:xanthine dehydrogenase YagT iron-sulfur-binding subunit